MVKKFEAKSAPILTNGEIINFPTNFAKWSEPY